MINDDSMKGVTGMKTFIVEAIVDGKKQELEYEARAYYDVKPLFKKDHPTGRLISVVDKKTWDEATAHMIASNDSQPYFH